MFFPYYGKKAHVSGNSGSVTSFVHTITFYCCDTFSYAVHLCALSDHSASMSLPHYLFIGQVRAASRCSAALADKGGF